MFTKEELKEALAEGYDKTYKDFVRGDVLESPIGNRYLVVEGGTISLQNLNYCPKDEYDDFTYKKVGYLETLSPKGDGTSLKQEIEREAKG